jgi:predicted permease
LSFTEFRYAFRSLRRSPGFAITLIGVLALGIGANTAIFSAVNSILLHPVGIREPERLVVPRVKYTKLHLDAISLSPRDLGDLRQTGIFSSVTAISRSDFNYAEEDHVPVRLQAAAVNWEFFDVFGVRPRLGRAFSREEDLPNRNREAILSDGLWRTAFGADPAVIGRHAMLNGESFEIVGVMPPEFQYPSTTQLWVPLGLPTSEYTTGVRWDEKLLVVGRLSEGGQFPQAAARIELLGGQIVTREHENMAGDGFGLFAVAFLTFNNAAVRSHLLILLGAVGMVLLIACANMAGLMLARASHRSREYAVRVALGATRWNILAFSLAESLLISVAAASVGMILGVGGAHLLMLASPPQFSAGVPIHTDLFVLGFTATITALTAIFTGIAPGLYMFQGNSLGIHFAARSTSLARQRLRGALVAAELSLALVLLIGAGLFLRSLIRLHEVDPGYDAQGLLTAQLALPSSGRYKDAAQRVEFYRQALERVRALPGVRSAAWAAALPLAGNGGSGSFEIGGRHPLPGQPWPHGNQRYVTPDFLRALKVPLSKGRFFTDADREGGEPVCVIDELLARRYWPDRDPIGDKIDAEGKKCNIVGVIAHIRRRIADEEIKGEYIFPMYQQPPFASGLAIRTEGDPLALARGVREAIHAIDAGQSIYSVRSMQSLIDESLAPRRLAVTLLGAFAMFALILAALGIFGMIAYSVTQRTPEFGLRMALGASSGDVLRMVFAQGVRLAAVGIGVGLIIAALVARLVRSMLFGVAAVDLVTFTGMGAVLLGVVLLATYLPARWATLIDPGTALRHE